MDVSETVLPEREIADNAWASPAVLQCFALMDPAVSRALIGVRRAELDLFRSSVFASSEDITEDVLQSKTTVDTAAYHQAVVVETNPSKTMGFEGQNKEVGDSPEEKIQETVRSKRQECSGVPEQKRTTECHVG